MSVLSYIHHVPNEVMAWIGGRAGKAGGEESAVENRATAVVGGIAKGGAGKGMSAGKGGVPSVKPGA